MLQRLVPLLSPSVLHSVVTAMVISRLDYGNSAYLGLSNSVLSKLQVVMNDAAWLFMGLPRSARTTPLLHPLNWLPIKERVDFKTLCIIFKAINDTAPAFVASRIALYATNHKLRSTGTGLLSVPRFKKSTGDGRVFSACAPKLWNSLPLDLRLEPVYLRFRKCLKTRLLVQAVG